MNSAIHEIIVDINNGTYTANPVLDIAQGDGNSHVLLFKLKNNEGDFVSLSSDSTAKIYFYRDDSEDIIISSTVKIVNYARGVLSYVVGPAVVQDATRYTCKLDISQCSCGCSCVPSVIFVLNVFKCNDLVGGSNKVDYEVTIPKSLYDELQEHLRNWSIHLSEEDRMYLDGLIAIYDEIVDLVTNGNRPTYVNISGDSVTVADNTWYKATDVTSLTVSYPEEGHFECWMLLETAETGTVSIVFPESSRYEVGVVDLTKNNTTYSITIRDGIVTVVEVE